MAKKNKNEIMISLNEIGDMKRIYEGEYKHQPNFMIIKRLKNEIGIYMAKGDNYKGMIHKMRFERRTNPWIFVEKAIKKSPDHPTITYLNKVLGKRLTKKEIKDGVDYLIGRNWIVKHKRQFIYIREPIQQKGVRA